MLLCHDDEDIERQARTYKFAVSECFRACDIFLEDMTLEHHLVALIMAWHNMKSLYCKIFLWKFHLCDPYLTLGNDHAWFGNIVCWLPDMSVLKHLVMILIFRIVDSEYHRKTGQKPWMHILWPVPPVVIVITSTVFC